MGSQADKPDKNKITLLKLTDINKTYVKAGMNVLHLESLLL